MDVIEDIELKARKDHKCDYCNLLITKGQKYRYSTIVDDGMYSFETHLSCEELVRKLEMHEDQDYQGLGDNDFREYVIQEYTHITDQLVVKFDLKEFKLMLEIVLDSMRIEHDYKLPTE